MKKLKKKCGLLQIEVMEMEMRNQIKIFLLIFIFPRKSGREGIQERKKSRNLNKIFPQFLLSIN